jgi:hypothetical protein
MVVFVGLKYGLTIKHGEEWRLKSSNMVQNMVVQWGDYEENMDNLLKNFPSQHIWGRSVLGCHLFFQG